MTRLMTKVLSDDPLIRSMSYQSVLSAFGEGAFLTGSAVYFTQIVGLSPAQVGLGLTIGGIVVFCASVPLGRLADAVGTRRTWILGSLLEALLFASWFLVEGFAAYVAVTIALELAASWMRSGRNAYRFEVFPRETRVRSLAYMRASRNVGYTLGAGAGGLALAAGSDGPIMAIPLVTAVILLLNTAWITRMPRLSREAEAHAEAGDTALEAAVAGSRRSDPRAALRNRPFILTSALGGLLLGSVWAPAAYTFLAMEVGTWGWITIGALVVVAAAGITPAARAAERHLVRVGTPGQAAVAG